MRKPDPHEGDLRWSDWAFVLVLTVVAVWGALEFVQFLFDRLW